MHTFIILLGILLIPYSICHGQNYQYRQVYTNLRPMDHFSHNNMSYCHNFDNMNKEYEPWTRELMVAASLPWYKSKELFKAIRHMRSMDMCKDNERVNALHILNSVPTEAPFSRRCRFPERSYYLCEGFDGWDVKFSNLRAALSFDNCTLGRIEFFRASSKFYKVVRKRNGDSDGLIDRYDFERMFRVYWMNPGQRPDMVPPRNPTNTPPAPDFGIPGFPNAG